MNIPVPNDSDIEKDNEATKIAVSTTMAKTPPEEPAKPELTSLQKPVSNEPEKTDKDADEAPDNSKIAELVSSKQYFLGIKEKRSSPLLTVSLHQKKSRKVKKKSTKKVENKSDAKSTKKVETKKAKIIKLSIVLVLTVGTFLAIDTGTIDIGWKPPFTIFGEKQNGELPALNSGSVQ